MPTDSPPAWEALEDGNPVDRLGDRPLTALATKWVTQDDDREQ